MAEEIEDRMPETISIDAPPLADKIEAPAAAPAKGNIPTAMPTAAVMVVNNGNVPRDIANRSYSRERNQRERGDRD